MPTFTEKYPDKTLQQLHAAPANAVGRLGRIVVLADESYTVDPRDDLILITATTSVGSNYVLTFPASLPANFHASVFQLAAPTGSDHYETDGLFSEVEFTAAKQSVDVMTPVVGTNLTSAGNPAAPLSTTGDLTVGDDATIAGSATIGEGLTVATVGITVTAGGIRVTAGGLVITAGALDLNLAGVRNAADDAAAALLVPAVPVGGVYRTGSALKIRAA